MMKFLRYIFIVLLPIILFACKDKEDEPQGEDSRAVLVYMVSDNNLGTSRYDLMDINEMREAVDAGALAKGQRLIVYNDGRGRAPVMFEVRRGRLDTLLTYPENTVSVNPAQLASVIRDFNNISSAPSRGIIFWSHGTGWLQDGLDSSRQRSFGYQNGTTMNITGLADGLTAGKWDWVYFDCCYMMSVETLYELRHTAPLFVGSVTELPSKGMPYQLNLKYFFARPDADMEGASASTFAYYDAQEGSARTCTMSVVRASELDELAAATRAVYETVTPGIPAGYNPQRFMSPGIDPCYYYDFADYVRFLAKDNPDLLDRFNTAFASAVTFSRATPQLWARVSLDRCNGLSTHILPSDGDATLKNYYTLQWYTDVARSFRNPDQQ